MSDPDILNVWHEQRLVGQLWRNMNGAIERIDYHLAFDVGGERNPGVITSAHWEALARACDVRPQFLGNLVRQTATELRESVGQVREDFEVRYDVYPALQRIVKVVTTQCRRICKE
ncbi:MAG: hypothetical protein WEB57_13720 [Pseudohongiellaceae bacterium]